MKKKTLFRILLAVLITIGLYFGYKAIYPAKTETGTKEVQLTILIKQEDDSLKTIFDQKVKTDAEVLADLLLELNANNTLSVTLSGSESDPYGRTLLAIDGYETTDWTNGPWWLYNSDNNPDCVAAGYCSGIDSCPIYDQDSFVFTFTDTY
ncbi:MAG: hypothetical protein VB012_03980 [Erysipelotrichaceae bacterium]|nr:hypothetical protein [Erysipelotrichaceae bacterium]